MPTEQYKAERKATIMACVEAYLEEWLAEEGDEFVGAEPTAWGTTAAAHGRATPKNGDEW